MVRRRRPQVAWQTCGWGLLVGGVPVAVLAVTAIRVHRIGGFDATWWGYDRLMSVLIALVLLAGGLCIIRGRRMALRSAEETVASSDRPAVLYLRSFADDRLLGRRMLGWAHTLEVEIERAFRPFGPVLCIGNPTDTLPEIGVAREYVAEEEWKRHASERISEAALVVVLAGGGKGLAWEVAEVLSRQAPHRVILLVAHAAGYERFRAAVGHLFARPLPAWSRRSWGARQNVQGLIEFGSDWKPHVKQFPTWRLIVGGVQRSLELALRDVSLRMGVMRTVRRFTAQEALFLLLLAGAGVTAIFVGWLELRG